MIHCQSRHCSNRTAGILFTRSYVLISSSILADIQRLLLGEKRETRRNRSCTQEERVCRRKEELGGISEVELLGIEGPLITKGKDRERAITSVGRRDRFSLAGKENKMGLSEKDNKGERSFG